MAEILTLLFGAFAYEVSADQRVGTLRNAIEIWNRWDGPHYLRIAQRGYERAGDPRFLIVFYPLFPWIVRVAIAFTRDPLLSAFLVSGIFSVLAAVAFARLVAIDYPEPVPYRSAWFMLIFPTAYFLHIPYTESLFLTLAIGAFLAVRRDRWLFASILGAFASLTRTNGLLLLAALGVEALHRWVSERRWRWQWLWIGLIPSGFVGYLLLNYEVTGDPFTFTQYERLHWDQSLIWPWKQVGIMTAVFNWHTPYEAQMIGLQVMLYLAIGLAAVIGSIFMLRPSYAVWMVANWLLIACLSWDLSAPRYLLGMFPMFIMFARLGRNRQFDAIITFWSLASMGVFIANFVRGWWAF
jgi:hypothetical protein